MSLTGSLAGLILFFSLHITTTRVILTTQLPDTAIKNEIKGLEGKTLSPDDLNNFLKLMILRHNLSNLIIVKKGKTFFFYPVAKSYIKKIIITGNYRLSREQLLKLLPFSEDDEWKAYYRDYAIERIKNYAASLGLFDCKSSILFDRRNGIVKIEIEEGPPYWIYNVHLDEGDDRYKKLLSQLTGTEYSKKKIDSFISRLTEQLMEKGYLNPRVEIRVCGVDRYIKAVSLCAVVIPGEKIKIRFTGNRYFTSEELFFTLGLNKKKRITYGYIQELKHRLQKMYYKNCFPLVHIEIKTEKKKKHIKVYNFIIREGPRLPVSEIHFTGNEKIPSEKLLSVMFQKPFSFPLNLFFHRCYDPEEFKKDIEAVKSFYIHNGFLQVKIARERLIYGGNRLRIVVPVQEGKQFILYNIMVTGAKFYSYEKLRKLLKLKEGEPVDPFAIEKGVSQISSLYKNSGFKDVSVRYSISTTDPARTTVTIYINEGKRYFWDEIFVSGNKEVSTKFIREKINIRKGEAFSQSKYFSIYSRLYETGYFRTIRLSTLPHGNKLDLIIDVKERPSNTIDISFALGTEEGISTDIRFSTWYFLGGIRRITFYNKAEYDYSNFQTLMHQWTPPSYGVISFLYKEPVSPRYNLSTQIFSSLEINSKYTRYSYTVNKNGAGIVKKFSGKTELSFTYELDNYNFYQVNDINFTGPRKFTLGYFDLVFLRDRRNDIFMPTSGNYQLLSLDLGLKNLYSDFDYFRYRGTFAWFLSLRKVTAEIVVKTGEVYSSNKIYLPDILKFYIGGAYTLRGYAEDSISATYSSVSGANLHMGGVSMFDYQVDIDFPLFDHFAFVIFNDGGNVWPSNFTEMKNFTLRFGAGWGLKYKTPLGPITFNVGYPLPKEKGIAPYQLYFLIKTFI